MISPKTTETVRTWTVHCVETYPIDVEERSSSVFVELSKWGWVDGSNQRLAFKVHESQLRGLADLLAHLAGEAEARNAALAEDIDA